MLNNLLQSLSVVQNPNQILQNYARQNPQINIILNQMQSSGMSPKQYVMQYAKQNNVDIRPLINMLSQRGIKL